MTDPTPGWAATDGQSSADAGDGLGAWQAPAGWGGQPDGGGYGGGYGAGYGGGAPAGPAAPGWQGGGAWRGAYGYGTPGGGPSPAPAPGVVPLRPLGLGEVLDGAVSVIRRYPRPTLGLSAVIATVSTLANVLLVLVAFRPLAELQNLDPGASSTDVFDGAVGGAVAGGGAGALVAALATVVLTGVLTAVVGRAVLGRPMTLGEAWREVKPLLWRLLGLSLLVNLLVILVLVAGIGVAAGLIAAFGVAGGIVGVPLAFAATAGAVFLWTRWSLAPAALVLEQSGVRQSMRRSALLVRRSWWRVLGILLLATVIASLVSQVITIPFLVVGAGVAQLSGGEVGDSIWLLVATQIGAGVAQALVRPFSTGVRSLLYVDRRMRAEGLDVSLQASAGAAQM